MIRSPYLSSLPSHITEGPAGSFSDCQIYGSCYNPLLKCQSETTQTLGHPLHPKYSTDLVLSGKDHKADSLYKGPLFILIYCPLIHRGWPQVSVSDSFAL